MHHSHEALDRSGGLTRVGLLLPLRDPEFRKLWVAMCVSLLGDGAFLVAVAWQVYELSNAPTAMSVVGIAMTVPTIVFLLIGGVASDRFDRRLVMVAADLLRAVAGAALAVLAAHPRHRGLAHSRHRRRVRHWRGVLRPGFDALVPDIVPPERLAQANALDQLMRPIVFRMAGPAIGGVLVASARPASSSRSTRLPSSSPRPPCSWCGSPRSPPPAVPPPRYAAICPRAGASCARGRGSGSRSRAPRSPTCASWDRSRCCSPTSSRTTSRETRATSAWCSPPAAWLGRLRHRHGPAGPTPPRHHVHLRVLDARHDRGRRLRRWRARSGS